MILPETVSKFRRELERYHPPLAKKLTDDELTAILTVVVRNIK